jgi:protein-tyrosine phosphatase
MAEPIKVMFFCLGNICRSPLAEGLFRHKVQERGLEHHFEIASSGTSSYHVGEAPDPGSQRVARERRGLDISHQRSQQLTRRHVEEFDVLIAMDDSNLRKALRWADSDDDVVLLRDYEPEPSDRGAGVPDPWGGGGSQFDLVFDIVDRCCDVLLDELVERHGL